MRTIVLVGLLALFSSAVLAQIPPGNAHGVSTGHIHLGVASADAGRAMWRDFGATELVEARLVFIKLPGIFVMQIERDPGGPSSASTVERVTFAVRDLAAYRARLDTLGAKLLDSDRKRILADLPGGVRVEFVRDSRLKNPIEYRRVLLATPDPEKLRAWYVDVFGAKPARHDGLLSADVPGGRVDFMKVAAAPMGSKGRAIDHIGFEVDDVDAFAAKLRARGIKLDVEPKLVASVNTKILFFTDPEGTYIELTQGLRAK
ncbi:MAG: VOC family protein [Pseudomonadota bacterium]